MNILKRLTELEVAYANGTFLKLLPINSALQAMSLPEAEKGSKKTGLGFGKGVFSLGKSPDDGGDP